MNSHGGGKAKTPENYYIKKENTIVILDELLKNIDRILDRITPSKLNAYALTQSRLREVDVSADHEYQKPITGSTAYGYRLLRLTVLTSI